MNKYDMLNTLIEDFIKRNDVNETEKQQLIKKIFFTDGKLARNFWQKIFLYAFETGKENFQNKKEFEKFIKKVYMDIFNRGTYIIKETLKIDGETLTFLFKDEKDLIKSYDKIIKKACEKFEGVLRIHFQKAVKEYKKKDIKPRPDL